MTHDIDNLPDHPATGADPDLDPAAGVPAGRPSFIPEKFWDPAAGEVRVDALAKSYRALERKLGAGEHLRADPEETGPEEADLEDFDPDAFFPEGFDPDHADGDLPDFDPDAIPARPEDYAVDPGHPWLEVDPQVMSALHAAGFTNEQAQLVYDLAAAHVVPALERMLAQVHRARDEHQLAGYFGSSTRYEEAARQIRDWGGANLPPEVFAGLSAHPNGVIAMFRLMQSDEPRFLGSAAAPGQLGEGDLRKLIADPKYWRDHDPATVRRVEDGFRRLYPERD